MIISAAVRFRGMDKGAAPLLRWRPAGWPVPAGRLHQARQAWADERGSLALVL